ncbi:PAS domain S-box-containing protein [Nitrosomonas cryotolerans]|uniref:histidine kinase n=1 Tax=Nitrosomonas cryotolerans ATCC 49181 TaxID=1131553 RepID=A0A1N6F330_9PROT|nr:PAS domain S-box protein [Nitrosomonas cryotolerans]SFP70273.1 PAS domain S-box-containing protein [Nitrosomonas cryotolerans]SIN89692.1 PAS domain S-box-containing protein [Nitrosomonas cryotolerans ATCC 49181]
MQNIWNWRFVRYWLYLCIPLILMLTAVLWLLCRTEINANLTMLQDHEQQSVQLAHKTIETVLGALNGDAFYLAAHSSLRQWLDTADPVAKENLAHDYQVFMQHRQRYDQLRFLNEQGQEVVRINDNNGQPGIVSAAQLQDKSDHYYVPETLEKNKDALYVSPFDLNIEHGVIEQPLKPVIRLSAPVFDDDGKNRGLVILNYLGARLLDRLRAIDKQNEGSLWLLNSDGYWLLGPSPEMEWGFMYPERQGIRFDREYGEPTWSAILQGHPDGQWLDAQGLFTYARINRVESQADSGNEWILVAHVPESVLTAKQARSVDNFVPPFLVLSLLFMLLSGVIAYYVLRRQQIEVQIRASEARFRGLVDSAPDAIVIADQCSRITLVNHRAEIWFGYSRDELLGQPIEQLVSEQFRAQYGQDQMQFFTEQRIRSSKVDPTLYGLRKDGSEFPMEVDLSPLTIDQNVFVINIIRNISAHKQAEKTQQRIQARYQDLVNNLPVGVYRLILDDKGEFIEVNPAMVKIFEAESMEQLLTYGIGELYCDPADRRIFVDKMLRNGQVNSEHLRLKTLNGREFHASITAVVKQGDAGERYADGLIKDISVGIEHKRRLKELNEHLRIRSAELATINRELEAFSYSVSHDLRAPLRAMDGFSRLLLNEYGDRLDDKGRDRLERIRAAAQRMAALIDDLLKLSRVTRTEVKWESVDLTRLTQEVMETLREDEPERVVQFLIEPGLIVQGDARLLRVAITNLLSNAWKFTRYRSEALIEIGCNENEGINTYFIRDNGAGFDMAYADKLFSAFQRLHDASTFPGTGVGLATVQRVISKHGGRIWAESVVDQGTTFYFILDEQENR